MKTQISQTLLHKTLDKTAARIVIMTAAGCLTIFLSGKAPAMQVSGNGKEALAASPSSAAADEADVSQDSGSGLLKQLFHRPAGLSLFSGSLQTDRASYRPSVLKYNLMALVPDRDLPIAASDVSMKNLGRRLYELYGHLAGRFRLPYQEAAESTYGGILYEDLNRKDAQWMSGLYQWIQDTPEQAAARLGLPLSSVTGSYDPSNPEQDSENPSTWLIPAWKNIKIQVLDGDGKPSSLSSNAKAIAALASVYTYYKGWNDVEAFKAYADQLWNASHSYTVSFSDVYYCDGCTEPPIAPLDGDAGETESQVNGVPLDGQEGDSGALEGAAAGEGAREESESGQESVNKTQRETADEAERGSGPASDSDALAQSSNTDSLAGGPSDSSSTVGSNTASSNTVSSTDKTDGSTETNLETNSSTTFAEGGDLTSAAEASGEPAQLQLNDEGKFCPGHVDLIIKVKINGLTENHNLFTLDAAKGEGDGQGWPGWNGYTKAYAKQLYEQDWHKEYGLSLAPLAFGTPLTSAQIADYMDLLPGDTSDVRKSVIAFALNSVGRVPYYYGGKAKAQGYENNPFYAPAPPDRKGRILSGLDCSGWINWVYWSVTGTEPSFYGTKGLSQAGHAVSRNSLQPGDIIVRPGTDSHVMMFLGWTDNHSMICVHETGGSISNVTVSVVNVDWPFYRNLID